MGSKITGDTQPVPNIAHDIWNHETLTCYALLPQFSHKQFLFGSRKLKLTKKPYKSAVTSPAGPPTVAMQNRIWHQCCFQNIEVYTQAQPPLHHQVPHKPIPKKEISGLSDSFRPRSAVAAAKYAPALSPPIANRFLSLPSFSTLLPTHCPVSNMSLWAAGYLYSGAGRWNGITLIPAIKKTVL